jgi:hypothetical protein
MTYNSSNYQEQGGSSWVVDGTLTVNGTMTIAATATVGVPRVTKVALAAVDTAGGVFAWANPAGAAILVHSVHLDVTTFTTGACTIDVGVAANGTTLNDTLIDGASLATAAKVLNSATNAGSNGSMSRKVTSTQFVTGSVASGASAGLVGNAYIVWSVI